MKKYGSVVVKPSISRGGRNVFIIENKKLIRKNTNRERNTELSYFKKNYLNKLKNNYPLMVMEKLNDPVFDLDIIAENGKLDFTLLRKRLNPRDPNSGHKIIMRKDIGFIAKKISALLKLNSINDCDFMINKKNNLKLLEINPRPSGSFAVPNLLGINLMDYILSKNLDVSKKIKIKKNKKRYIYH